MANAKKCDRCGIYFDQPVKPDIAISQYTHGYGSFEIDLCPACQESLQMFLHNQPVVPSDEYLKKVSEQR